jgi:hypothetical protein
MNAPSKAYQEAKQFARFMLENQSHPQPEMIRQKAEQAAQFAQQSTPGETVDVELLIRELESDFSQFIAIGRVLEDATDHIPWLPNKRAQIEWKFWDRYYRLLFERSGLPVPIVNNLDTVTDQVLERLEDPRRAGSWDRRGLVVGSVQSGKTGNYTGLICKAIDAGYKIVIILAGMHNSLRSQTQLRTDQGVIGFDTSKNPFYNQGNERVGVGLLAGDLLRISSLTNSAEKGDFSKKIGRSALTPLGGDPFILIVKKNKSVLKNLLEWALRNGVPSQNGVALQAGDEKKIIRDVPLLLIDDEADIASINTKAVPAGEKPADYQPTAINEKIRQLLQAFDQSAYVGYTATPFANIFIDPENPDDIFPRSFILNLEQPGNYVGPARVFGLDDDPDAGIEGREPLPLVREVNDHEEYFPAKFGTGHDPGGLPPSMREAIRAFILVCAARRARGQETRHNSMLIHVARFVNVQRIVRDLVGAELKMLQRRIEYGDGSGPSLRVELRELWEREFEPKTAIINEVIVQEMKQAPLQSLTWDEIEPHLHAAAAKIDVKEINGEAQDVLDYFEYHDTGRSVIAIGGDKLSRGLTLEGLSVSYYLRMTKMYDTLMQMGRWFGYRDGYLDLCRLYTTNELRESYRHIALADLELRREFEAMWMAGRTPKDYGLRVRTHPDGMLVTALNKARLGKKRQLSYTGELMQTTHLDKKSAIVESNRAATDEFLSGLGTATLLRDIQTNTKRDVRLWRDVPAGKVTAWLRGFIVNAKSFRSDAKRLADYIEKQREGGGDDLAGWTVTLLSNANAPQEKQCTIGGQTNVGLIERDPQRDDKGNEKEKDVYALRKNNIISPPDQFLDFAGEVVTSDFIARALAKRVFQGEQAYEEREAIQESSGRPVMELVKHLSGLRQARTDPTGARTVSTNNGRIARELRSDARGLLLIYPLDPKPENGIVNLDTDGPVMGFAISFPVSERARPIEYMVNEVYLSLTEAYEFEDDADDDL